MIRRFELIIDNTQWVHIDEITNLTQDNFSPKWYMSSLTVEDFIQSKSWQEVSYSGFDPNDLQGGKPCCGGGLGTGTTYAFGKWHSNDCDSLKAPQLPAPPSGSPYAWVPSPSSKKEKCTCGSSAVGSNRHSDWCDVK